MPLSAVGTVGGREGGKVGPGDHWESLKRERWQRWRARSPCWPGKFRKQGGEERVERRNQEREQGEGTVEGHRSV